jgi:[acyl-carrier-protein] S-malonyltransferase
MRPALLVCKAFAADIAVTDSKIGLLSNKDGAPLLSGVRILDRIIEQIASPVRWDLCMASMESMGVTHAIEIAPAGTLVGLLKRGVPDIQTYAIKSPDDLDSARTFAGVKG